MVVKAAEGDAAPFILTVQFDLETDAVFQRLRRSHFPPELDRVPAHLTLFHQLPGTMEREVVAAAAEVAAREAPFPVLVEGPTPLGRGVALKLSGAGLGRVRGALKERFRDHLTGQDRQKFRPHVTIQNKVTPERARRTLEAVARGFVPFEGRAEGIQLWRYRGGPWQPAGTIAFAGR